MYPRMSLKSELWRLVAVISGPLIAGLVFMTLGCLNLHISSNFLYKVV